MWPFLELFGARLETASLLLALGVGVAVGTLFWATRKRRLGLGFLADHFLLLLLGTLVGARLSELFFRGYAWGDLFLFWQGLELWGGLVGFLVALFLLTRRAGQSFLAWLDISALAFLAALPFQHLGTLLAGTAYGSSTTLPWGLTFTHPDSAILSDIPLHPTQLYFLLASVAILFLALTIFRRNSTAGTTGLAALLGLAVASFFLDFLRDDSVPAFGALRISQYYALVIGLITGIAEARLHRQNSAARRGELKLNPTDTPNPPPSHA